MKDNTVRNLQMFLLVWQLDLRSSVHLLEGGRDRMNVNSLNIGLGCWQNPHERQWGAVSANWACWDILHHGPHRICDLLLTAAQSVKTTQPKVVSFWTLELNNSS